MTVRTGTRGARRAEAAVVGEMLACCRQWWGVGIPSRRRACLKLAPGPLRLWRRRDGIPAPPGDHHCPRRAGGIYPGAEVCRRRFFLFDESLGISLPCLVILADLRMACTEAYRSGPLLTARYSTGDSTTAVVLIIYGRAASRIPSCRGLILKRCRGSDRCREPMDEHFGDPAPLRGHC